jgi:Anti-sigma factor NepR
MRIHSPGPGQLGSSRGELVRSAKDETKRPLKPKGGTESSKPSRSVGDALRQAYDEAVRETVPDDLLDLLKKLD